MINLKIFFGSQTGNAEDLAEKLYKFSLSLPQDHITSEIHEMNHFNFHSQSKNDINIFICSTTGQGDPPDNMKLFWRTIMSRSFKNFSQSFDFAIFGLGDSKYTKFNFIAKKLYRRLNQFNVKPIIYLGLADDQHERGIDGDFDPWLKTLWIYFENKINNNINTNLFYILKKNQYFQKYNVEFIYNNNNNDNDVEKDIAELCPVEFHKYSVESNEPMTPSNHFQDTRLITFQNDANLQYELGNVLTVYPKNSKKNISKFFDLTPNLNRSNWIRALSCNRYFPLPAMLRNWPIQIETVVEHVFDLNSVPRKSFFESFAALSCFEMEKERLLELSDPNNLDDLYSYCFRPKRTIVEVMEDFPRTSEHITMDQWVNLIPPIRTRDYSIASSYNVHQKRIQLLVSRVKFKTKMYSEREGLCSGFLCDLKPNEQVFGKINRGSIRFPNDANFPVILIGPGTGIAAFRGYLSERMLRPVTGCTLLCFGNRYRNRDFYFGTEFQEYEESNKLKLLTAFSREENLYIQHKLKQQSSMVWKTINNPDGFLYICGRSDNMPQQVHEEIRRILMNEGNLSESQAEMLLTNMQKFQRYQIETWS